MRRRTDVWLLIAILLVSVGIPNRAAAQYALFGAGLSHGLATSALLLKSAASARLEHTNQWKIASSGVALQSSSTRSVLITHTVVGLVAGGVIGLVLSGSDIDGSRTDTIVIWTLIGGTAGLVSGALTCLVGSCGS